jgi:hypothetical protein
MQVFSYWTDVRLFGISPEAAHLHSLLSFLVTAALLYMVVVRLTDDVPASACVTVLWLCLPSTIGVHYFLATRHYMEGFGWALAACFGLLTLAPHQDASIGRYVAIMACAIAAMLSKEIYAALMPTVLALYAVMTRRRSFALTSLFLVAFYVSYHVLILDPDVRYPEPLLRGREFLRFLRVLPYTLTSNWGGSLLYGGLLMGCALLLILDRKGSQPTVLTMAGLFGAAMIAIYPTAYAVLMTYRTPGTWYRATFIVNTGVLLAAGYLLIRYTPRWVQVLCLGVFIAFLVPGVQKTQSYWTERLARSREEGTFYMRNPDKLLYSEEDAFWYIPGIERLYGISPSHYIDKSHVESEHTKRMLRTFGTVWRWRDGAWSTDDTLYTSIKARCEAGRR